MTINAISKRILAHNSMMSEQAWLNGIFVLRAIEAGVMGGRQYPKTFDLNESVDTKAEVDEFFAQEEVRRANWRASHNKEC